MTGTLPLFKTYHNLLKFIPQHKILNSQTLFLNTGLWDHVRCCIHLRISIKDLQVVNNATKCPVCRLWIIAIMLSLCDSYWFQREQILSNFEILASNYYHAIGMIYYSVCNSITDLQPFKSVETALEDRQVLGKQLW